METKLTNLDASVVTADLGGYVVTRDGQFIVSYVCVNGNARVHQVGTP